MTALLTIFTNSHTHKPLQTLVQSSDSDCQSVANSVETRARTARNRSLRRSDQLKRLKSDTRSRLGLLLVQYTVDRGERGNT